MSRLVATDPGVKRCYHAFFYCGALCGIRKHLPSTQFMERGDLVIEIPVLYPNKGKGDPNDIVRLARAAQQVIDLGCSTGWNIVTECKPRAWKGQVPKPIHHMRAWNALSGAERLILPPETLSRIQTGVAGGPYSWDGHNFLDAVALGLKHLKRVR